jgi:hypothetical protein
VYNFSKKCSSYLFVIPRVGERVGIDGGDHLWDHS